MLGEEEARQRRLGSQHSVNICKQEESEQGGGIAAYYVRWQNPLFHKGLEELSAN